MPDWVCEVLSPSSAAYDTGPKMDLYARMSVPRYWIVDPQNHTVLVLELVQGVWAVRASAGNENVIRLPPFDDLEISPERMWIP